MMLREFFLGFVKIHILHHAAQEAVYDAAIIVELRRHGCAPCLGWVRCWTV